MANIANPFRSSTPVGGEIDRLITGLYSGNPAMMEERQARAANMRQQAQLREMQMEKMRSDAAYSQQERTADPMQTLTEGLFGKDRAPGIVDYMKNSGITPARPGVPVVDTTGNGDEYGMTAGVAPTPMERPVGFSPESESLIGKLTPAIIASRMLPGKTTYEQATKGAGELQAQDIIAQALQGKLSPQQQQDVSGARSKPTFVQSAPGQVLGSYTGTTDDTSPLAAANITELGAKSTQARAAAGLSGVRAAQVRSETLPIVEIPSPTAGAPPVKVVGRDYGKAIAASQAKPQAAGITDEGLMPMAWDALLFGKNPPGMGNLPGAQRALVANKRASIGHGLGLSDPEIAMLPNDNKVKNKAYGNAVNWGTQVDRSTGVLNDSLDAAIETAKRLPLSTIQMVNKGVLAGLKEFNDPDANVLASQLMTVRREYGRLVNGPTSNAMLPVEAMKQGDQVLSTGVDLPSLIAVGDWFKKEAAITQHRTNGVIQGLRTSMVPVAKGTAPGAAPSGIPTVASDADYNALPSGSQYIAPDGSTRKKP